MVLFSQFVCFRFFILWWVYRHKWEFFFQLQISPYSFARFMCGRPLNLHILLLHTDTDYNKFSMSSSYSCILQYYANNFLQLYCIRLQGEQLEFCKPFNNARVDVFCIIFIWLFGESIRESEWKWEESRQSHVHVEDGKINWKYVRLWFVFRPHFSIHSLTLSLYTAPCS